MPPSLHDDAGQMEHLKHDEVNVMTDLVAFLREDRGSGHEHSLRALSTLAFVATMISRKRVKTTFRAHMGVEHRDYVVCLNLQAHGSV